jgi:hypothetical protein
MAFSLHDALAPLSATDRCRVVIRVAEQLVQAIAAKGDDAASGEAAVAAMKRFADGEPVSGRIFSDLVYDEDGEGVALHTMEGQHTDATPEWTALTVAVMYVGWHAYKAAGERMPEDIAEVDEDTLGMLDNLWRATAGYDPTPVAEAVRSPQ